jgi:hypothetical protein
MAEINIKPDCGNAPRKLFLKDFHIALVEGDTQFINDNVDEKISWEFVGDKTIKGKADFAKAVEKKVSEKVAMLTVSNIITHGKEAAVNGEIEAEDGKMYSFCDVYAFQGAKGNTIKSITSYVIALKKEK